MHTASPRTVLYVDDEEINRVVFQHTFSKRFSVVTCASGAEALQIVERESPTIIVTDQRMLGMSGVELLEAVRSIDASIGRVVLTAWENDPDVLRHNGAGVCGCVQRHFTKPFDRVEIEAAMSDIALAHDVAATIARVDAFCATDDQRRDEWAARMVSK